MTVQFLHHLIRVDLVMFDCYLLEVFPFLMKEREWGREGEMGMTGRETIISIYILYINSI